MLQVKLPPVVLAQQETTVNDEHAPYQERIGKILQDRPESDIQICPRVASWEFMTEEEKSGLEGGALLSMMPKRTTCCTLVSSGLRRYRICSKRNMVSPTIDY